MTEKSPSEQANDLRARWNPLPEDNGIALLVGMTPPEGDTRATAHVRNPALDHKGNAAIDRLDGGADPSAFTDDLDGEGDEGGVDDGEFHLPEIPEDDDGNPDYDNMKNDDLKAHLAARDLPVSGKHADLVARLEADDEDDSDEDDDDEE